MTPTDKHTLAGLTAQYQHYGATARHLRRLATQIAVDTASHLGGDDHDLLPDIVAERLINQLDDEVADADRDAPEQQAAYDDQVLGSGGILTQPVPHYPSSPEPGQRARKATPRLVATVNLRVEVYLETEPGSSNPITGTELPYEYLAIRDVKNTGCEVVSQYRPQLALLDHDDAPLDVDDLIEDAVRDALAEHLPQDYRTEQT